MPKGPLNIEAMARAHSADATTQRKVADAFRGRMDELKGTFKGKARLRQAIQNIIAACAFDVREYCQRVFFATRIHAPKGTRQEDYQRMCDEAEAALEEPDATTLKQQYVEHTARFLLEKVRVRIGQAISNPTAYAAQIKIPTKEEPHVPGKPKRGQLRRRADEQGAQPKPIDRQAGEGMGREKDPNE